MTRLNLPMRDDHKAERAFNEQGHDVICAQYSRRSGVIMAACYYSKYGLFFVS